jgi:phage shock protein A
MKVLDRFTTLLRADAHGLMENLEERSLVIKQHLRDADLALEAKRRKLAKFEEERRLLEAQRVDLDEELVAIDADVELALAQGEEELARYAVRRLLPRREARQRLDARATALTAEVEALSVELAGQQAEFEDLSRSAEAELLALDRRASAGGESSETASHGRPAVEEAVELELLRRRVAGDPNQSNREANS